MIIEELKLSLRVYNALKRAGIDTVEQIKSCDISKVRGVGEKSYAEIVEKVKERDRM